LYIYYALKHSKYNVFSGKSQALEEKMRYLSSVLLSLRPAFARTSTFCWFAVVVVGFIVRSDFYGVSSVVRALGLPPNAYFALLHFFRSSACLVSCLLEYWQRWVLNSGTAVLVDGRHVILGDHTNSVKDARRMPGVRTIHQHSETASKPSFFRGHVWSCLGLLARSMAKSVSLPLMAEIHPFGGEDSQAVRPVVKALEIVMRFSLKAFLVLDAFFATGPVFSKASESNGRLHVVTRAKSNAVAFRLPPKNRKPGRGRPKKYGGKVKVFNVFKERKTDFMKTKASVYGRMETIQYLVMDLIWKPVKGLLRFFWVKSSRGDIVIMTSDLSLQVRDACFLYCRRATIETFFDVLKNLLGGMAYHFWSRYLEPISRRPKKNETKPVSRNPARTAETLSAIHKFLVVQVISAGIIQLLSMKANSEIARRADCWQRTSTLPDYPSPFVVISVMRKMVAGILCGFGKDWISRLIRQKRRNGKMPKDIEKVA
jgi:hypothetical protein